MATPSPGNPGPLLDVRTAVIFVIALLVGAVIGVLTLLAGAPPAAASLAAMTSAGATITPLNSIIR